MNNFDKVDLQNIKSVVVKAGQQLISFWSNRAQLNVDYKEGLGLVSEADREVEEFLIRELSRELPEAKFCAEESSFIKEYNEDEVKKGYCWMIDPLDGTNNFLSGFDYFSISIALSFDGKPILGIVYRPIRGDLFFAQKGEGSFYENIKEDSGPSLLSLKIPRPKRLREALLCTGFAGEKGVKFDKEFETFKKLMMNSRGVRRLGSAALDLCYLAKGSWHGFWEKGLAPWDVSAGALICTEAGLEVFSLESDHFSPFDSSIIACPKEFKSEFLSQLKG